MKKRNGLILLVVVMIIVSSFLAWYVSGKKENTSKDASELAKCTKAVTAMRNDSSTSSLVEKYKDLTVIDMQNLDANHYQKSESLFKKYQLDRVGIAGWIAQESGILSDELAWEAFKSKPDFYYPYFANFDMFQPEGIETIKQNLEKGYVAVGEVAAASTQSAILRDVPWKAKNPLDGNLPKLYELAGKYKVPVILHIDPPQPTTPPMKIFEKAMDQYPDTMFIFDHGNVFNSGKNLEQLLKRHKNLYISMYPGFTAYDPNGGDNLKDYVPVMNQYPDRFFVMSDSGSNITEEKAYKAFYRLFDLLDPKAVCLSSHLNLEKMVDNQPATKTQIGLLKEYAEQLGEKYKEPKNKLTASKAIFSQQKKLGIFENSYTNVENLPTMKSTQMKTWEDLTDQDLVVIGRDLLAKFEKGMFSTEFQEAKDDFAGYYQKIFFPDGLSKEYQDSYASLETLNRYQFNRFIISHETVQKETDYFVYTTDLLEDLTNVDSKKTSVYHSKYRLYIAFDQNTKTYKIQKELAVPLD